MPRGLAIVYYRRNFLSASYSSLGRGLHAIGKLLKVGSNLSCVETKEIRERKSVWWATERSGRIAQHFPKSTEEGALRSEKNHPAFSRAREDELPQERLLIQNQYRVIVAQCF